MPRLRYRGSDIVQGQCAKQITIVRVGSSSGPKPESDSMARATSSIIGAIFVLKLAFVGDARHWGRGGGADGRVCGVRTQVVIAKFGSVNITCSIRFSLCAKKRLLASLFTLPD